MNANADVHIRRYDAERGQGSERSSTQTLPPGYGCTICPFSPSRRMFCLICAFDFILTLMMWIIYAQGFSNGLATAFKEQVKNYTFQESLFDILVLSLWRMTVLLLAYALFHSRTWYVIAVTTAFTSGFLVAKVFKFKFEEQSSGAHPVDYILILVSLILCWGETWHLDFKVIPSELKAEERLLGSLHTTAGERDPLLGGRSSGYYTPSWVSEHTSFFTPEPSPPGSDNESDYKTQQASTRLSEEDRAYVRKGKETIGITQVLLNMDDKWKVEKSRNGITVESHVTPRGKKIYRLKGFLDAPLDDVFDLIILHPEDSLKWGNNLTECRVLREIDEHTDIVYNVTGEAGGGLVSSRDFINLRRWEKQGDVYVSCNSAVTYDGMPPRKECVRAENGPGGWILQHAALGRPHETQYTWLFDVDLKGWLPQYVIDAAMTTMLYKSGEQLRLYVNEQLGIDTQQGNDDARLTQSNQPGL